MEETKCLNPNPAVEGLSKSSNLFQRNDMTTDRGLITGHPAGEQPLVECGKPDGVVADTFAGRVHTPCRLEWEAGERAAVTALGQLPFFIEYLKQAGCSMAGLRGARCI